MEYLVLGTILSISIVVLGCKIIFPKTTNQLLAGEPREPSEPPLASRQIPDVLEKNPSNGLVLFDSNLELIYVHQSIHDLLPEVSSDPESLAEIAQFDDLSPEPSENTNGYTSTLSPSSRLQLRGGDRDLSMKVIQLGPDDRDKLLYAGLTEYEGEN